MKSPANGGPLRKSSVAVIPAAVAAAIGLRALRAGIGAPGKRAAQLVPELIIAGIGIVWSLVLAVGVWIELSAVAGVIDNLLRRYLRCGHCRHERQSCQEREFRHGCSPWNKSACRSNAPRPCAVGVQWPKLVQLVHLLYEKVHHKFQPVA